MMMMMVFVIVTDGDDIRCKCNTIYDVDTCNSFKQSKVIYRWPKK